MSVSDEEVFERFDNVLITHDNVEHYRGLLQQKLLVNHCEDCGYWIYPHRPLCPRCWSWSVTPTEVSGRGRVHLLTRIQQARVNDAAGRKLGDAIVLVAVELAEQQGLRYLSTVDGVAFEDLRHDMEVELTWVERGDRLVPAFRPVWTKEEARIG